MKKTIWYYIKEPARGLVTSNQGRLKCLHVDSDSNESIDVADVDPNTPAVLPTVSRF